jgi:hypothetical protein
MLHNFLNEYVEVKNKESVLDYYSSRVHFYVLHP